MENNLLKVLIVEDNPGDLRLVNEMLRESGSHVFKTAHAGRLAEALKALEKETFEVVLLDLDLPDSSGLAGLEKISALHPAVPVIVLTGRADEATGLKALQTGAADYLTKGNIDPGLLARSVRYAIERKRNAALLDNERRNLQLIFDGVSVGMLLLDENGAVRRANNTIAGWLGKKDGVACGVPPGGALDCVHALSEPGGCGRSPACRDCSIRGAFESALRSGEPVRGLEARADLSPGGVPVRMWFEVNVNPLVIGGKKHAVLSLNDITARKGKEAELRKLNRLFKARNDSDQAMLHAENEQEYLDKICRIIVEDCGHAFVWIGFAEQDEAKSVRPVAQAGFEEGYLETLKLTWADTELGRGPTGTAIRTGRPSACADMRTDPAFAPWRAEAVKRGYASSLVLPLLAGGQAFGALMIYSKKPDNFSAEEVKLLTGLADDLSYGIRTLRLRAAHKLSEEDVQRLAHVGVWQLDLATNVLTWSKEIFRIFEIDPERFGASYEAFLNAVHPEERGMVAKAYEDSVRNRTRYDVTHRLLMPDGRVKYVNEHCETFYGADGRPQRSVGTVHDITDRKEAEAGLLLAQEELARAKRLSDIGTLAATVAHELRNPLATIGMAAVNIRRKARNPDLERHLINIDKKVFESNQIINNLLFYSRLKPPHYERVGIFGLLEEVVGAAGERFGGNVDIETDISGLKGVMVDADPIQIKEVLNNLLNNAGDAIADGRGKVEVSGARENGFVRLAVKDSGRGIDKATLERVFDPFFTTKAKGTGLGLSVCRQIIDFHGGGIELRSEPGSGTTARILLPVKRQGAPAARC